MQHFLSTLLTLLPLVAAAPLNQARDDNPGCQDKSFHDFKWTIEDFDYHASYIFSTPAHQISNGFASFNLTNPGLAYKASCDARSTRLQDFFYGEMVYTCTNTPADGEGEASTTTETTFSFSRPSGRLDVNQTWVCGDADPKYPTTFHAYGTANLTLECTEDYQENPDWEMGQIYSSRLINCGKLTIPMKPYELSAVA